MIVEYKSKTVSFVVSGLLLQVVGGLIAKAGFLGWLLGGPVALLGSVLLILGCCFYAKAKGYAWWLGLLGLLSCVGFLVLYVLPDQHK